jgi:hypothetical protein
MSSFPISAPNYQHTKMCRVPDSSTVFDARVPSAAARVIGAFSPLFGRAIASRPLADLRINKRNDLWTTNGL